MKKRENIHLKNNIKQNFYNKKNYLKKKLEAKKILEKITRELDLNKNAFHSLSKKFKLSFNNKDLKKYKKYKTVAIFGMGGSILGANAIYSFLQKKINKRFLFFDNLDQTKINNFNNKENIREILFIFISKSGDTIETITNINLIRKNKINLKNTIIITENKNNTLKRLSEKLKIYFVEHKKYIGGRYSVLSEVGMLPASLMGLSINSIRKNLIKYFKKENKNLLIDSVAKIANIYLDKKINTIIFFNYCPELKNFLFWCQQLIAESLGKKGKGLLPVISTAPKDHHSLLQLYLDGPKDKIFYVFSSKNDNNSKTPSNITRNTFKIINAQKESFIKVLEKKNIPYREFNINKFNEQTIGELFAYFILETGVCGKLINVNPFDQPAVEEVKIITKKLLS